MTNRELLEKRLNQVVETIESVESFIQQLDFAVPAAAKQMIIKAFKSKEISAIVDGIKERRPPRLVLIGRSGVGKSSLINAMTGAYVAKTSAVHVGTEEATIFQYEKDGEVLFEIIDTRGIKENLQLTGQTAEEDLQKAIERFEPDAFLLLTNGADRSTFKEDAYYVKQLLTNLQFSVPLITVITRVDELEPARIKEPEQYTVKKKEQIALKEQQIKEVLAEIELTSSFVIAVSSYLEWSNEDPHELRAEEKAELVIDFDGRYNIEQLTEFLEENIDFRAAVYMMLNHKIEVAIKKIAKRFVNVFSTASAGVALTPIPVSDMFVLIPIQIMEVVLVAYLNGKIIDAKAAREFIVSLGGIALFGYGLRFVAQQGSKFMNVIVPGSGSAISSAIAYSGTYAIGQAAIAYYVDGVTKAEAKKELKKAAEQIKKEKI